MSMQSDNYSDDDLDSTAELPQLNLAAAGATLAGSDGTTEFAVSTAQLSGLRIDASEHWVLMDELVTVRDKIVSLESALIDAEGKQSRLQTAHDALQIQHTELLTYSRDVEGDRNRLAEERTLWLEAKRQLQDQLETQRVESNSALQRLQDLLQQQQTVAEGLQQDLNAQRAERDADRQQHEQQRQTLVEQLQSQQQQGEQLSTALETMRLQHDQQHASAAALARSLAAELIEKTELQQQITVRVERIVALEGRLAETNKQLEAAQSNGEALLKSVTRYQQQLDDQTRHSAELQSSLTAANERIERLVAQVETENGHWRSAEQDKERLRHSADVERDNHERTRRELAERQNDITSLQDRLSRASTEIDQLSQQLNERQTILQSREQLLSERDRQLQEMQNAQSAAGAREATLNERLGLVQDELKQTEDALAKQTELYTASIESLETERQNAVRQTDEADTLRQQLEQTQLRLQERDKFVLEQARELDTALHDCQELQERLQQRDGTIAAQSARNQELSAGLQQLQEDHTRESALLRQVRQELEVRNHEQGLSVQQIEALKQELHQHAEAMNAIRHDIHQVAMQGRGREDETLVRTLTRADNESVVHLLNRGSMTIGRGRESDIRIHSESMSRQHACLRISRDAVIIEDMDSTNGSYVNGRRIKRQLLKDGDTLDIGEVKLLFSARPTNT